MRKVLFFARLAVILVCSAAISSQAQEPKVYLVAPTEALTPAEEQKLFHLPPGFEIQLIAAEPEIHKPINMAFDAAGRLFVTSTVEYPWPVTEGTPRDTIKLISDTNNDGVPDKVTTFADGLNIPIGVLPLTDGSVLGYSIPSIYRFTDTDGDGRAEKRDIAYSSFGFDDTHGMASSFSWSLDGWIHACHGFRNNSNVKGTDGESLLMNSGNTYRLRLDGSHIEQFTHGQVNPFGMCFDDLGNLYTADCHSKPIYMLLRNAYYPSFGKPHDGLGYGPEMISHSHYSTGICGLVYYDAPNFPPEYRHTVFIGNPVTGRINHDKLALQGSTKIAVEQPDFVSCDDPWFKPVDIKLAPDGSVYIADFYNCIIGHYEVDLRHPRRDRERGRIWRVVYTGDKGKKHSPAKNLAKAGVDDLIAALGDENIVVRTQAVHHLAQRIGKDAVEAVKKALAEGTPLQRAHALWVIARVAFFRGEEVEKLAKDQDRTVRVHLAKAMGALVWDGPSENIRKLVIGLLNDPDAFVRRAAADTLGRHPHADNVQPLIELWRKSPGEDTHLIHATRISLRDTLQALGDLAPIAKRFADDADSTRRLADVAVGIRTNAGAEFLLAHIQTPAADGNRIPEFLQHATRYIDKDSLAKAIGQAVALKATSDDGRQVATLRGVQRALQERAAPLPDEIRRWALEASERFLKADNEGAARTGIELSREFGLRENVAALEPLAKPDPRFGNLRQPALEAVAALDLKRGVSLIGQAIGSSTDPIPLRQKGAELLGNINSAESRATLSELLRSVPDQVAVAIARGLAGSKEGAETLVAQISTGKASARLLQDAVVTGKLQAQKIPGLEDKVKNLVKDLPAEDERTQKLIATRLDGFRKGKPDPAKGVEVYTKICAACHRAENKGTKVGPDLDGIGLRGADRLLEDVLAPNRNVDGAFRATTIALKDGKVVTGLIARDEGEIRIVINEQGKEVRVPKSEIDEQNVTNLSPMPANIAEQLPEADFYHLVAYLLSLKSAPAGK